MSTTQIETSDVQRREDAAAAEAQPEASAPRAEDVERQAMMELTQQLGKRVPDADVEPKLSRRQRRQQTRQPDQQAEHIAIAMQAYETDHLRDQGNDNTIARHRDGTRKRRGGPVERPQQPVRLFPAFRAPDPTEVKDIPPGMVPRWVSIYGPGGHESSQRMEMFAHYGGVIAKDPKTGKNRTRNGGELVLMLIPQANYAAFVYHHMPKGVDNPHAPTLTAQGAAEATGLMHEIREMNNRSLDDDIASLYVGRRHGTRVGTVGVRDTGQSRGDDDGFEEVFHPEGDDDDE